MNACIYHTRQAFICTNTFHFKPEYTCIVQNKFLKWFHICIYSNSSKMYILIIVLTCFTQKSNRAI